MAEVTLKSKMSMESLQTDILDKIYHLINEKLFDPAPTDEEDNGDDTDFESDSGDWPNKKKLTIEALEMIKEESVKVYKSCIITKLVESFNNIDLQKYTEGIEKDLESLSDLKKGLPEPDLFEEEEDATSLLEKKVVQIMKDYLESRYSQSILIDSVE